MFHRGEQPILNTPMLQIFWKSIEYNLYENDKRYKTSVENGKLGGAPKGNKNALKNKYDLEEQPNQPNQPNSTKEQPKQLWVNQNNLNDNGNDDVNVNDDVNGNDNEYVSVSVSVDDNDEETYQQFCNRNKLSFGSESISLFQKFKLK